MKKNAMKIVLVLLAVVLLVGGTIGGTLAWLTAKTNAVTNTFTVGNIDITLTETKNDFKMVPGSTIDKDPTVTVKANSEACWLFVKVEESNNLKDFITYTMADGWKELEAGVYYREVTAATADQEFAVLANDEVTVNDTVTKAMMDGLGNQGPTLTFTAYAVQKENIAAAAAAWVQANSAT